MIKKGQQGIILLSTVLISSLLVVLILQFSYSNLLEHLMARHNRDFVQREIYLESAGALCRQYAKKVANRSDFTEETFSVDLLNSQKIQTTEEEEAENTRVTIRFYDESGKFNLNSLLLSTSAGDKATRLIQLQRLLTILSETNGELSPHLTSLSQFMEAQQVPLKSLRELEHASTSPPQTLIDGLRRFITTTDERRINVRTAPIEVVRSLHPQLDESSAKQLRKYFLTGKGGGGIKKIAAQVDRYTTLTGSSFGADIRLRGPEGKSRVRIQIHFNRANNRASLTSWERVFKKTVSVEGARTDGPSVGSSSK